MKNSNYSFEKNTIILLLGSILGKGISFILFPILSHKVSTETYGLFDVISTYISLLIPVISLQTHEAMVRYSVTANEHERRENICTCLVIFFVATGVICVIIYGIGTNCRWDFLYSFIFMFAGASLYNYNLGFLRAIKRLELYSITNAIYLLSLLIMVITINSPSISLERLLMIYGIGYWLCNLVVLVLFRLVFYIRKKYFSLSTMKKLLQYAYPLIPNNIAWWVINVSDRSIISIYLGSSFNGIYAASNKIPSFLNSLLNVVGISWQQSTIEKLNDLEKEVYYNEKYNNWFASFTSLSCVCLCLNYFYFNYFVDQQYYSAFHYTPILIIATYCMAFLHYFTGILLAHSKTKLIGASTVMGAIINLLIHMALLPYISIYAAAISTLISQLVVTIIRFCTIKKMYDIQISKKLMCLNLPHLYFFVCSYMVKNRFIICGNLIFAIALLIVVNRKKIINVFKMIKIWRN